MKPILAPHKEQNGWVYVRVPKDLVGIEGLMDGADYYTAHTDHGFLVVDNGEEYGYGYDDTRTGSRVVSSRRVEEAVETADYLKRCEEEGLVAVFDYSDGWHVGLHTRSVAPLGGQRVTGAHGYSSAPTLREAYWRFKNAPRKEKVCD